MKETKKYDNWIGLLSISVVAIIVFVFVLTVSNTHIAKGTYAASGCSPACGAGYECQYIPDPDCVASCGAGACLNPEEDCFHIYSCIKSSSPTPKPSSSSTVTATCYKCTVQDSTCPSGYRYQYAWKQAYSGCQSVGTTTQSNCSGSNLCVLEDKAPTQRPTTNPGETTTTSYTITFLNANGDGKEYNKTCKTSSNGKLPSSCITEISSVCSSWSTTKWNGSTPQTDGVAASSLGSKTFSKNTTYYCVAGTSIHSGEDNSGGSSGSTPKPTTEKPSSTQKTTITPTTNAEPTPSSNPTTGTTGIIVAWIVGLSAIVYSLWYYKKSSMVN